jgi:septal ring factor EnvC (AmiA/AmiB activator)
MDNPLVAGLVGVLGGSFGTGMFGWLSARVKQTKSPPADLATAYASFAAAVNTTAEQLLAGQRQEIDELRDRLDASEDKHEKCQSENRQLRQVIDSLIGNLRREGINLPAGLTVGAFTVIEGDHTTVYKPAPKTKRSRRPN